MGITAILVAIILIVLLYIGNRFLRDARAIRSELADGASLKELNEMTNESREQLLNDYDGITGSLDKRIDRLERLNRDAEVMASRLDGLLNSERLKTLEDRGILFAIEAGDELGHGKADKNRRIVELLKGGASVEEVARLTEASVREVELVRLLLKRGGKAEGA